MIIREQPQEKGEDSWEPGLHRPIPPGKNLGFVKRLREADVWPLSRARRGDRKLPTVTPYLVVPATTGDIGVRPLPVSQGLYSSSLEILDAGGTPVMNPTSGNSYTLRCRVINRGAMAAYAGMAEFYIGLPADFDLAAATPGSRLPALGYIGIVVPPGESAIITCPSLWTPTTVQEAAGSVLVRIYDPFIDPLISPFDALHDRHVGRRDILPNFNGTWEGVYSIVGNPLSTFLIRLVIVQNGLIVTMADYEEVSGGLPANPQQTGNGTISGGQVQIAITEYLSTGERFTENHWTLSLPDPDTLHLEYHQQFVLPDDNRGEHHLRGDLHRV